MKNELTPNGVPKSRKVWVEQPQFIEVEYWGADKYVNHELDPIFKAAEDDPERPQDFHPGWWAVLKTFADKKTAWNTGAVLAELPFRYIEDLDPKTNIEKIFSLVKPDQDMIETFKSSFVYTTRTYLFDANIPEPELESTFWDFLLILQKFYLNLPYK